MNTLIQIALLLLVAFLGFMAGGAVGAMTVPQGSGLAGPATVFIYGVGGLVVAIGVGGFLVARLSKRHMRRAFMAAAALSVVAIGWIVFRIAAP